MQISRFCLTALDSFINLAALRNQPDKHLYLYDEHGDNANDANHKTDGLQMFVFTVQISVLTDCMCDSNTQHDIPGILL